MPSTNGTRCQLCVVAAIKDALSDLDALSAQLAQGGVAAVLCQYPGAASDIRIAIEPVTARAHAAGVPVIVCGDRGDIEAIASLQVDGVQLAADETGRETIAAVRNALGPEAIIGVECGWSRHDAMLAGEAGADYVAFGPAHAADAQGEVVRTADLLAWWSEVFELPCVALGARGPDDARAFADAGADFVVADLTAAEPSEQTVRLFDHFAAAVASRSVTEPA